MESTFIIGKRMYIVFNCSVTGKLYVATYETL